jgi:hypothetical protein
MCRHAAAAVVLASLLAVSPAMSGMASATQWTAKLAAGSHGEATAQGLPAAPAGPAAACVSLFGTTVKVTWSAVPLATTYDVYQSTTSAGSGYVLVASGVLGTSWTTGSLASGSYWYEVAGVIGSHWVGTISAATAKRTITAGIFCT